MIRHCAVVFERAFVCDLRECHNCGRGRVLQVVQVGMCCKRGCVPDGSLCSLGIASSVSASFPLLWGRPSPLCPALSLPGPPTLLSPTLPMPTLAMPPLSMAGPPAGPGGLSGPALGHPMAPAPRLTADFPPPGTSDPARGPAGPEARPAVPGRPGGLPGSAP